MSTVQHAQALLLKYTLDSMAVLNSNLCCDSRGDPFWIYRSCLGRLGADLDMVF